MPSCLLSMEFAHCPATRFLLFRRVLCDLFANVGFPSVVLSASPLPYPPELGFGRGLALKISIVLFDFLDGRARRRVGLGDGLLLSSSSDRVLPTLCSWSLVDCSNLGLIGLGAFDQLEEPGLIPATRLYDFLRAFGRLPVST